MKSLVRFLSLLLIVCMISPVSALAQGNTTVIEDEAEEEVGELFSSQRYAPFSLFSASFRIVIMEQLAYSSGRMLTADMCVTFSSRAQMVEVTSIFQRYDQIKGKWIDESFQVNYAYDCLSYNPRVTYNISTPGKYRVFQEVFAFSGTTTSKYSMVTQDRTIS